MGHHKKLEGEERSKTISLPRARDRRNLTFPIQNKVKGFCALDLGKEMVFVRPSFPFLAMLLDSENIGKNRRVQRPSSATSKPGVSENFQWEKSKFSALDLRKGKLSRQSNLGVSCETLGLSKNLERNSATVPLVPRPNLVFWEF